MVKSLERARVARFRVLISVSTVGILLCVVACFVLWKYVLVNSLIVFRIGIPITAGICGIILSIGGAISLSDWRFGSLEELVKQHESRKGTREAIRSLIRQLENRYRVVFSRKHFTGRPESWLIEYYRDQVTPHLDSEGVEYQRITSRDDYSAALEDLGAEGQDLRELWRKRCKFVDWMTRFVYEPPAPAPPEPGQKQMTDPEWIELQFRDIATIDLLNQKARALVKEYPGLESDIESIADHVRERIKTRGRR